MVNPKIHILTRPNINKALIIVSKNKKATGFFELNFNKNTVTEGQWIKAKIYVRHCDLSFDGRHIIYFAAKFYKQSDPNIFTAVSRFPYFKALDFYDKGDTYNGGGLFIANNEYLLNETYKHKELYKHSKFKVKRGKLNNVLLDNATDGLYYPRLVRDGWQDEGDSDNARVFTKKYKHFKITKRCYINATRQQNKGTFYDINEFKVNGKTLLKVESDFMDFKNEKLYYVENSKLFVANLNAFENVKTLHDFSNYNYKAIIINYN